MRKVVFWIVIASCVAVYGETPYIPLQKDPVLICDFEKIPDVARWQGVPHGMGSVHATLGQHAMTFAIPKYIEGLEERPGVVLKFDGGKGFPFQDFTRYGKLAIDVWVEGDQPGKMGLKVRDTKGINSWTAHITVEPGKVNHAELLISDAMADADMTNVAEIVLYALRPEAAFLLTVDNLRLLPAETPPIASFDLQYPNYRNQIFPDHEKLAVQANLMLTENVMPSDDVELVLKANCGPDKIVKSFPITEPNGVNSLEMSAKHFKAGPVGLRAQLVQRTGKVLAERSWILKKLSKKDVEKLSVRVDQNRNLVCDGKPFFPLGWYGGVNETQMNEVADSPFNCMILYGVPDLAFMDKMQAKGLKLLSSMQYTPEMWERKDGKPSIGTTRMETTRHHPAILGWYLNDELPSTMAKKLEDHYRRVQELDPTRPAFFVLCSCPEFSKLAHTGDIFGFDHYPVPTEGLGTVGGFVDAANRAVHDAKPVWAVIQAFGWYQYRPDNGNRARIPTAEELMKGRAPTYDEVRCMTYIALAHGAKGIFYYCYYDMHVLPQYAEMWDWMKKIGGEVKELSPILLAPGEEVPVTFEPSTVSLHTRMKFVGKKRYLIAVNESDQSTDIVLKIENPVRAKVNVLFENRQLEVADGSLRDSFKPREAHVYEVE